SAPAPSQIYSLSLHDALPIFAVLITWEVAVGWLVIPLVFQGAANALSWSANSAISMRQLPGDLVGAGSGVYNTSRQVGAVIGARSEEHTSELQSRFETVYRLL